MTQAAILPFLYLGRYLGNARMSIHKVTCHCEQIVWVMHYKKATRMSIIGKPLISRRRALQAQREIPIASPLVC
jgi:hypothetical protein